MVLLSGHGLVSSQDEPEGHGSLITGVWWLDLQEPNNNCAVKSISLLIEPGVALFLLSHQTDTVVLPLSYCFVPVLTN